MNWMKFRAADQRDLIDKAVVAIALPKGISLRVTQNFQKDVRTITNLPMSDHDTMTPQFGMKSLDSDDGFTLVLEKDNQPIGHISCDLEMRNSSSFTSIELYVNGVFVSDLERRRGLGWILGKVSVDIAEAWRLRQAEHAGSNKDGDILIRGDTEDDGESLLNRMQEYADEICEDLDLA